MNIMTDTLVAMEWIDKANITTLSILSTWIKTSIFGKYVEYSKVTTTSRGGRVHYYNDKTGYKYYTSNWKAR